MTFKRMGGESVQATFSYSDKIALAALCLSVVAGISGAILGATLWLTSQNAEIKANIHAVSERVTRIEARLEERDRRPHP